MLNIFDETEVRFFRILWWVESSNEQDLFEIEIICNNNVFSVTFDSFNASFLNKSIIVFGFYHCHQTFSNVYISIIIILLFQTIWHLERTNTLFGVCFRYTVQNENRKIYIVSSEAVKLSWFIVNVMNYKLDTCVNLRGTNFINVTIIVLLTTVD